MDRRSDPATPNDASSSHEDNHPSQDTGIWIGIDLGTSNSACAVWDSTRGSPKWMRLPDIAFPEEKNGKVGRIMPSVVRWEQQQSEQASPSSPTDCEPLVGAKALKQGDSNSSLLQSVKRLLGKRFEDLDPQWLETLDYDVHASDDGDDDQSVQIVARTSSATTMKVTPQEVLAVELEALRIASQRYLDKYRAKKNLQIPGCKSTQEGNSNTQPPIRNVVVGVPAHFSKRHIQLIQDACRKAGFDGHVGTCLESTAAAMAYGLTMQETSRNATIMVVDMGGGTTDITIATQQEGENKVLVTQGDEYLGGDDIDQAMMEYCISRVPGSETQQLNVQLKASCRKAKEALCNVEDPATSQTIQVGKANHKVVITQEVFEKILTPWLQRAKSIILLAKTDLEEKSQTSVDEIILVGGTTRIPAVRKVVQSIFPKVELSTSLNPMSSVAQGLAIQAAIVSKEVPIHELKSALMLDCVPHAIGVQLAGNHRFVEIIPRNTPLPAKGTATFVLADKQQAGVTIRAVEEVGDNTYEPMSKEDFTFLLRRLSPSEFDSISERSIQVGMLVDTDGKFVVSIFDENDPEQIRKKERFERTNGNREVVGELAYITDLMMAESGMTTEQVLLSVTLVSVFVAYIAVKIAFSDPEEIDGTILG